MATIKIKKIYENPETDDGYRVLVDRLWPRGVSKKKAKLDLWLKEVAPSNDLRKWFNHQPEHFEEFKKRYKTELLTNSSLKELEQVVQKHSTVTLLYSAHDPKLNQAIVLLAFLKERR